MALSTKPGPSQPSSPRSATPPTGAGRAAQGASPAGKALPWRQRIDVKLLWNQGRRTLKGQFTVVSISMLLVAVLAGLFISGAFRQSYAYLHTIAIDSVPSVDAAQAMAEYIQDIDAKSADYLAAAGLTEQVACPIPGTSFNPGNITIHQCDDLTISAEITLANKELYIAAHNVTYPGERTAVERITAGFEEYVGDISVMRHEYALAASKTDPSDIHLIAARQAYIAANNVLLNRIAQQPTVDASGNPVYNEQGIPACVINDPLGNRTIAAKDWPLGGIQDNIDCLNSINKGFLDNAYHDAGNFLGYTIVLTLLLCLVFCLLIGFAAWRMAAVTHRFLNVGLTVALLVGIVFSFFVATHFVELSGQHGSYSQMVSEDYDSVYYAAQLKHYGTAANADESRWLIALEFGDQAAANHWQQDWLDNTSRVRMLITQVQANRTWPEEDQPLAAMQTNWNGYFTIDGQIRAAARNTGDPQRIITAERISTGISNQTFGKFTDAVDQLSLVDRGHFDQTYTSEAANLTLYTMLGLVLFPLIGLLAAWGVSRRFKDF
jgi:hypothetical protein